MQKCFSLMKVLIGFILSCGFVNWSLLQMASELHGMLAGNVSMVTGDNMKPAYGGEDESFLKLVVTPIYEVIARVGIYRPPSNVENHSLKLQCFY